MPALFVSLQKEAIVRFGLSNATSDFLLSVGLPSKLDENLKDKLLLTFYHTSPQIRETLLDGEKYVVIGDQEAVYIAIKQSTDEVFAIDEAQEVWNSPAKFINSDVQSFIECLQLYFSYEDELVNADDNEATRIVNRIKRQFTEIDSKSLDNSSSFWSEI